MTGFITENDFEWIAESFGVAFAMACHECGQGETFLDFMRICGLIG